MLLLLEPFSLTTVAAVEVVVELLFSAGGDVSTSPAGAAGVVVIRWCWLMSFMIGPFLI